ncbi:uncharacterized protein NPIL_587151 [Nephila pilipes]|uniref:CCHC-type domain-containing protein n=1 Tax=Nephila pilipes TaxID=299642 RepID=A0A8X6NKA4_NEPPI|nr:uncharacterized protein NPIL_587151 [Nephila pilipes]
MKNGGPRTHVKANEYLIDGNQETTRKPERFPKKEHSHAIPNEGSPFKCYGCGRPGVIKSRCPIYNSNSSRRTDEATNPVNAYATETRSPRLTLIDITFGAKKGLVCVDTGYSHSIVKEKMYQEYKDK